MLFKFKKKKLLNIALFVSFTVYTKKNSLPKI